ncbi:MAG: aspartate--tRNA ligase [Actinobacteria bacterium]|nr:aspartate--tRNA ligase [Actinomycetota bacterium]
MSSAADGRHEPLAPPRANAYRDTWATGAIEQPVGKEIAVSGWAHRRRDHGGLVFIDLRDRSGVLQIVFHPEHAAEAHEQAGSLRAEDVVSVRGKLVRRSDETINPNLPTGHLELQANELTILARSETPPFQVDDDGHVDESLRLKHRYLDLRRGTIAPIIALRHRVIQKMREVLNERDFLEVETPNLTRPTPEGARDYLVPSRVRPGNWYALPQSPQLYKQLLMMGGIERYYQIARCFRDEDLRADRQPEFTQLDIEMSFVEGEDVIEVTEAVLSAVLAEGGIHVETPFQRMCYAEAMGRFGSDSPDLRYGLEIVNLDKVFAGSEFKVFASVLSGGGTVRAINAGARELSRADLDELTEFVRGHGAGGLVWAFVEEDGGWRSPIAKFLSDQERADAVAATGAQTGDLLLAVADTDVHTAATALGALRRNLADRFELVQPGDHRLVWVVDFPMLEWNEGEKRWDPLHHPFTAPRGDLSDPATLMSDAYDIVMDGWEIGGGSLRINDPVVQHKILEVIGIDAAEAQERFGFLLEALKYGAPPHGGLALGLDRLVALIAGADSIRDAIAFPKSATGADPLTGAPAGVDERQIRDLHLVSTAPPPVAADASAAGPDSEAPDASDLGASGADPKV